MVPGKRVARSPRVAGCGGWREQSGDCGGPMQAANTQEVSLSGVLESKWSRGHLPWDHSSQLDWTQEETERKSRTAVRAAKESGVLPAGRQEPRKVQRATGLPQALPLSRLRAVTPKKLRHRPQAHPSNQPRPTNQPTNQ